MSHTAKVIIVGQSHICHTDITRRTNHQSVSANRNPPACAIIVILANRQIILYTVGMFYRVNGLINPATRVRDK